MSSYKSAYTGLEIDDAVARASEFGLGVGISSEEAITDCNNATACGWYLSRGAYNAPTLSTYGVLLVSARAGDSTKTQVFFSSDSSNKTIISVRSGGSTWGEWEYVNPPMVLGVEYRTTERYQGKPVYVKLVDFGKLPNSASKYVDPNISNFEKLIEPITVTIYRSETSVHGTPMVEDTNTYARSWFKMTAGGIAIRTMVDLSADSAIVKLKYTKTTN